MKLAKSLLLGSAATLVATAGYAADLPSKKAAPVNYVKVCDIYGAGFFYIPGTDTCLKVGGRARFDAAMSGKQDIYSSTAASYYDTGTGAKINTLSVAKGAQNIYGYEARGRVDLDARSATAYGTVQSVVSLRMSRVTGTLDSSGPSAGSLASSTTGDAPNANNASSTLEAAYIRFAGFTFGAAKDNFSFMPSTFYGAGHWASFANGAKQITYTAVLGGGFSATLGIQDASDTTAGGVNSPSYLNASNVLNAMAAANTGTWAYKNMPQINGRVDFDQAWGSAALMGAVGQTAAVNNTATYDPKKTVWAIGAGAKINLPMIAAGDVLWLNAAYADGMTEYTTNWTSFKSSDTKRVVGNFVTNHPSWINTMSTDGTTAKTETFKSWDIAALYTHFWAPQWRHSFLASYGKIDGTTTSKALTYGAVGAFGDASVWNVGTQLAFLPTKDFEIGVDVLYARVEQDIRRANETTTAGVFTPATASLANSTVTKEKQGNWTGRLRVERTF
jgi:hypothetical protein